MRLRTRLALVFFAISVLPLAAVTGYSYVASAAAMRRAVAVQAGQMAQEMGNRMAWVMADLGDRVERVWPINREQADTPRRAAALSTTDVTAALRGQAASVLGDAASMIERLELVPSAMEVGTSAVTRELQAGPANTTAAAGSGSAPRPESAHPRDRPGPPPPGGRGSGGRRGGLLPPRVVLEFSGPNAHMKGAPAGRALGGLGPEAIASWTKAIEQQVERERQAGGGLNMPSLQRQASDAARGAERQRAGVERQKRLVALARGEALRFPVWRDGEVVGEINATVSRHRMIETVLSLARRDRGEVPFVYDTDGEVHTSTAADGRLVASLNLERLRPTTAETGAAAMTGDWVVVTRRDASGIVFGIARPVGDSLRDIRNASFGNLALGLVLITGAFALIVPLASRLTRHITTLTAGVQRVARGDRTARVDVHSHDEVGDLARAFNQMAAELESHDQLLVRQERLNRELELCRQIQTDMLPHGTLRLGLTQIAGVSIPAREVGGDFFNYFVLPGGDIALLVGDVSGKGVGAALLMANIQATLRARLPLEPDLALLVAAIDRDIHENTPPEVYLTLFVAIFDPARRYLRYVNAGHNTQFVLRADGGLESLVSTGVPVGLMPGRGYEERQLPVDQGDLLFLYTDGAVDVENDAGDVFGTEALQALLVTAAAADVDAVLARVETAIREFRGRADPLDDATMMAVRLGPPQEFTAA